jgi:hypothetical protein
MKWGYFVISRLFSSAVLLFNRVLIFKNLFMHWIWYMISVLIKTYDQHTTNHKPETINGVQRL